MTVSFKQNLKEHLKAAFSGIWLNSYEPEECLKEVCEVSQDLKARLAVWDIGNGLQWPFESQMNKPQMQSPVDPLRFLGNLQESEESPPAKLLVLKNFHRFLENAQVSQVLSNEVFKGKSTRTFFLVLSPKVELPLEIEKQFTILDYALPTEEALKEIALEMPKVVEVSESVLKAGVGLTRGEFENACALSLVRKKELDAEVVWDLKTQAVKKRGGLSIFRGKVGFESLGGLENLKSFSRRLLRPGQKLCPKGLLLLGPPGSGKSAWCKALGKEVSRPTLILDIGGMYSKHVGDTEQNIRQALDTADAMGEVILMLDEVDKSLSGHSGEGDSGVSSRLFGTLLTWLSDRDDRGSRVFLVATANSIKGLPPAFSRSGRFDGIFFIDLPAKSEREKIWQIYRQKYELNEEDLIPDDEGYSGADIEECCRLAALMDVPLKQAALNVIPGSKTYGESVQELRQWAVGKCISASEPGFYREVSQMPRRNVVD